MQNAIESTEVNLKKENRWLQTLGWKEKELDDLRSVSYCYIKQGIYDIALTLFETILVLTTPTLYDLKTIGALYLQQSDPKKALYFLDQALALDPQDETTKINRIKAFFMLGQKEEALLLAQKLEESGMTKMKDKAKAFLLSHQN